MRVAVLSESWLLDFWEFSKEALEFPRGADDLEGRGRTWSGKSCLDGAVHLVIHKTDQSLPLEIHAEVVGGEKIGAEEWPGNVGQDELVGEGDVGENEVAG